jgi:hypothetical protein
MENGHVWTAIDLACADDDEAKQRAANLSNGREVEVWQGDRRLGLLRLRRRSSAYSVFNSEGAISLERAMSHLDAIQRRRPER